ncbi:hypothetical protein SUVZ_12G0420 [Saccharomyces uvarum]|uniref:Uncharacterized protein n=1 Tax=Saccharomyces uvarum TaxID=230603 RepID=A0ABN8WIH1_SACUV|nr:hypothetical protein SUVZ_12G0420 [Saccharomyces uvarum]
MAPSTVLEGCPYGYRPYPDNTTNALNPCFLSMVSSWQAVFFLLVGTYQLQKLYRNKKVPPKFKSFPIYPGKISSRHAMHLTNICFQSTLILCQLALVAQQSDEIYPSILKNALYLNLLFNVGISLPTQYLEYFKSTYSLGNQLFYYMFQIFMQSFLIVQRYYHSSSEQKLTLISGQAAMILEFLILGNSVTIFVYDLCLFEPIKELAEYYKENDWYPPVNVLSYITFIWMNKLIMKTYRDKKIENPDKLPLPPVDLDIRTISKEFEGNWELEKWLDRNSLQRAIWKSFGKTISIAVLYETTSDLLSVIQPQFLRLFIDGFNPETSAKYPPLNGVFIALALFLISVISVFLSNQFYIGIYEAGLGMRGSLASLVYQKSLKLSLAERNNKSTGDILNLMSVDVLRIQRFFENAQTIIGAPIQIIVVLTSLYWLLGNAVIGGLVTMAIMMPINALLSKKAKKLSKTQMKYKDMRIKTITELLNAIKSIKLYAWEEPMMEKLNHVRNDMELKNFRKIGIVSNLIYFAWNCVPLMVTCSTFGLFSLFNDTPLSPSIVFPSLSLFNILNSAIYSVPSMINSIIETSVSMERLKSFLLSDEVDDSFIERTDSPSDDSVLPVLEMNNITFLWKSKEALASSQLENNSRTDEESIMGSSQIALKNIDHFEAKRGDLICVVGRVGAGKSTFLKAILGQLPCMSGSKESLAPKLIIRASSLAYCSQESWIMNASVRENILFGHKFDKAYYDLTIKACQLLPDLKILPDGDETLVGEKGISLSGGQKARLSLARAVYSRADIYLLDDILSAVDAEVSKNIIEHVLIGKTALLKNKTIILTTNTVSILKHSQMIYALDNGEIVEQGNYESVMKRENDSSKLKKLLEEFDTPIDNMNESDTRTDQSPEYDVGDTLQLKVVESEAEDEVATNGELELIKVNSRRASLATLRPRPFIGAQLNATKKTAQQAEKTEVGRVKTKVYLAYVKACGVLGVVLFFLFMILTRVFDLAENFWLKYWSESNERNGSNERVWMFVGVYSLLGVGSAAFNNLRSIIMLLYCSIRGSKKLHENMAKSVIRSPMVFFETTPVGRIINRFSSDMDAVDSSLQYVFSFFFKSILTYLVTIILVGYNMPWFLVFNMFLLVIYIYYQTFYIVLSRELKRLISISYSPIMSLMSESLNGYSIIDAYNHYERFIYLNYDKIQSNIDLVFNFRSINRWLSVRLQTIGATIVLATALLALATINTKNQLSSGMVGLLMAYSFEVTSSLTWIVRTTVMIETNIVSVERIVEYCELPPEAQSINPEKRPDANWPSEGRIEFKNYSTKYRENLDPVLKDINVSIQPCEKIGIVGRTGAGKSTLSLALFRILEPSEGEIIIDDVNISELGLFDLRSNLAIIPQDAQAFEGTVRTNLDPFNRYSEDELKKAIELAHLKSHLEKMLGNETENNDNNVEEHRSARDILDVKINENGSNLSVGQRQLLCLARALLSHSKILVLDEATASVDMETDKIIQDTIRREFKDRTILTIAHRIDTVLDSDKIIVLDKGNVKEFDSPSKLLSDKGSIFYSLCEKGGYLKQ